MTNTSDAAKSSARNHHDRCSGRSWWTHQVSRCSPISRPETDMVTVSAQTRTAGSIRPIMWERAPCPAGFGVECMVLQTMMPPGSRPAASASYDQVVPVQTEAAQASDVQEPPVHASPDVQVPPVQVPPVQVPPVQVPPVH